MTRNPDRIPEVLAAIQRVWEHNSDMRLSQLLLNLDLNYYTEDEDLVRMIQTFPLYGRG